MSREPKTKPTAQTEREDAWMHVSELLKPILRKLEPEDGAERKGRSSLAQGLKRRGSER